MSRYKVVLGVSAAILCLVLPVHAQTDQPPPSVDGYNVTYLPSEIAPTLINGAQANVTVFGQPRMRVGHPCTLWDQQDIERYKELLKSNTALQTALASITARLDRRITEPLDVVEPKQGPDGKWLYPGDSIPPNVDRNHGLFRTNEANAFSISELGTAYALTGDPKYGEYSRELILAYAHDYSEWGHPEGWTIKRYRSAVDGRLTGQFLEDGGWLIQVARGYDLVYNLPSWTPADREQVRDFFDEVAEEFTDPVLGPVDYLSQTHNRSVICACGVLIAGYACDDPRLVNAALYGKNGTKDNPTGGLYGVHLGPNCIDADGMWNEGAMGYQFMTLCALVDDAETLWHHGVNIYTYRNAVLKRLFDSPLEFAYPDMTLPSVHDSGRVPLIDSPAKWQVNDVHHVYEYAYLRYRDPRYLEVLSKNTPDLDMSIHQGPPSVLFGPIDDQKPAEIAAENVNFAICGYGILRLNGANGIDSLLLEYGPSRSHSHPDKLALDLYVFGDVLLPDPGSVFPYSLPLEDGWYQTTLGHCALVVDESNQIDFANKWKLPKDTPDPQATQIVYAPGTTIGLERAWSDTVATGVVEDRSLFFTPEYVADIFGAFSNSQHTYDLAYHIRGAVTSTPTLSPMPGLDMSQPGYDSLKDVGHFATDDAWKVTTVCNGHQTRLVSPACAGADVIEGSGYYSPNKDEPTPAVIERHNAQNTVYGNAIDISGEADGYVKSVGLAGGLADGYALITVQTIQGTDLCFASYRPGAYRSGNFETDGLQAFVRMNGSKVQALYLAGGMELKVGAAILTRSKPGLVSLEKLGDWHYILSNPSSDTATITLSLPDLARSTVTLLDRSGHKLEAAPIGPVSASGLFSATLGDGEEVEFRP